MSPRLNLRSKSSVRFLLIFFLFSIVHPNCSIHFSLSNVIVLSTQGGYITSTKLQCHQSFKLPELIPTSSQCAVCLYHPNGIQPTPLGLGWHCKWLENNYNRKLLSQAFYRNIEQMVRQPRSLLLDIRKFIPSRKGFSTCRITFWSINQIADEYHKI